MSTGKNMNRDMRQIKQQIKHSLPKNQRRINTKKKNPKYPMTCGPVINNNSIIFGTVHEVFCVCIKQC